MFKSMTKQQKTLALAAALLVLGAKALSELGQPAALPAARGAVGAWQAQPAYPQGDRLAPRDYGAAIGAQGYGDAQNPAADPWGTPYATQPSSGFGSQDTVPLTGSDFGSDAITQGYWDRQARQDGVYQGMDNQINDQVTLQNQATGERVQAEAGSDYYYQSPSVDAAMGASTVVGADAGSTVPADATPYSVVGTGTSSTTSSSGAGEP